MYRLDCPPHRGLPRGRECADGTGIQNYQKLWYPVDFILLQSQLSRDFLGWLRGELPSPIDVGVLLFQILTILLIAVLQSLLDFPATVRDGKAMR